MRTTVAGLAAALLLSVVVTPSAHAQFSARTITNQPGATLLLPYFEVTLKAPKAGAQPGKDTYFSVANTSATAILVKVTVWSDLGIPVLGIHGYLTGYDVQSWDLGDIIRNGKLPATASAGQDPTDTISPKGSISQDINFASCTGKLPTTQLPPDVVAHVKASLTGQFSSVLGGCAGLNVGDGLARGFVTVDTVNNCTDRSPADAGYFGPGGSGDATNQNVLYGDYQYVDASTGKAEGDSLVSIKTNTTDPNTTTSGQYTFYGTYDAFTAADNRQPLATTFAARYTKDTTVFTQGTSLTVWRDQKLAQGPFTCGTNPAWYPLGQEDIAVFDELENPQIPVVIPVSPQPPTATYIPFPAVANKTLVGGSALPVPFDAGWLYLDLNTTLSIAPASGYPPEDPAAAQAWVTSWFDGKSVEASARAARFDGASSAQHFHVGP